MAEARSLVLGGAGVSPEDFAGLLAEASVVTYAGLARECIVKAMREAGDPGSDWHWMAGACFAEAVRRRCPGLYDRVLRRVCGEPGAAG